LLLFNLNSATGTTQVDKLISGLEGAEALINAVRGNEA